MAAPLLLHLWALTATAISPGVGDLPRELERPATSAPDFDREVRPILSEHCFACHGPDEGSRKSGLRLDTPEGAFADLGGGLHPVVAGDLEASEIWDRITTDDPGDLMPPPETGKEIDAAEREVLRRWIESGATWEGHWAWEAPSRPEVPSAGAAWAQNPIDAFIAEGLDAASLEPAPAADRASLLRRVTLDLTGMPPTPEELDAFLADEDEGALERVLDRLFASPRYGEHLGRIWLDAARYADTHGLHLDNLRLMWPYRDWVIDAYNRNLPFDQFTIEQLAGDLLPDATEEQRIASGFNRCNPTSAEGGMIAEEYLSIYAKDRTDTTATVFLGVSMGCAQCHDHKYDPFTQRDYYSMLGFFNSLTEEASDRNITNPVPFVRVADEEARAELAALDARIDELAAALEAPMPEVDADQVRWEQAWTEELAGRWLIVSPSSATSSGGSTLELRGDQSILVTGTNPARDVYEVEFSVREERITALRLEALAHESLIGGLPGRAVNGNFVMTGVEVAAAPRAGGEWEEVTLSQATAQWSQQDGYPVTDALDNQPGGGWGGLGRKGNRDAAFAPVEPFGFEGGTRVRVRLRFESVHAQHAIGHFRLAISEDPSLLASAAGEWWLAERQALSGARADANAPHPFTGGIDLRAESDGKPTWARKPDFGDGAIHMFPPTIGSYYLTRTWAVPSAREVEISFGSDDGARVFVNGARAFANPAARGVAADQDKFRLQLEQGLNTILVEVNNYGGATGFYWRVVGEAEGDLPASVALTLASPAAERSQPEQAELKDVFRREFAPQWIAVRDELADSRTRRTQLEGGLPTTMVSQERMDRRPARVLMRGAYDSPGEEVQPDDPASLMPLPSDAPRNRLGLAQWLVSGENPLTARVVVNRHWQRLFGTGLVKTSEDFGIQGERPSHPELLDWLAVELVESGWDLQHLQRLMIGSATYQQASVTTPAKLERDPRNRLLSRGARFRLDAEVIRDQALEVSGLLVDEVGGPSVRPYQPAGLWKAVGYSSSNTVQFRQDPGEANYRRSLYTFWKRTSAPPNLVIFDAPSRETTCVRRERTNTPMQALVLLNDPQFVEFAHAFARRILGEAPEADAERVAWAWRMLTGRAPSEAESGAVLGLLEEARAHFASDPEGAADLLRVGATPFEGGDRAAELAAWSVIASTLFNLDEVVTHS
jgi:hypothetical protein